METTKEVKVIVCDSCGKEKPLVKCNFCGAMICGTCSARVMYMQTEDVRGHCIGFWHDKIMCQKHLPEIK